MEIVIVLRTLPLNCLFTYLAIQMLLFFLLFVLVGCPFRHSDPELLKQKLQVYKVPPSGISQVGAVLSVSGPPAIISYL